VTRGEVCLQSTGVQIFPQSCGPSSHSSVSSYSAVCSSDFLPLIRTSLVSSLRSMRTPPSAPHPIGCPHHTVQVLVQVTLPHRLEDLPPDYSVSPLSITSCFSQLPDFIVLYFHHKIVLCVPYQSNKATVSPLRRARES